MTGLDSFDDAPWVLRLIDFTRRVLDDNYKRAIGVCFGHQIIARALGADVGRSATGWEISVTPMDLTETGKKFFRQNSLVRTFHLLFTIQQSTR